MIMSRDVVSAQCLQGGIREKVEKFYGQLYVPICRAQKAEARDIEYVYWDIPDIEVGEIKAALGELKNGRAPADDGITTELNKGGERSTLKAIEEL
ncbi:unnamed protein product [Euphydryas editha]|uniref:Uncharacterized protein n=1 Tax=Euphydryas editha TaxID=104508 RepID=A0AAU9UV72_EUPED|nr:unnamed protein product [Euphydryas editha]